jgi:hypothetical protein
LRRALESRAVIARAKAMEQLEGRLLEIEIETVREATERVR